MRKHALIAALLGAVLAILLAPPQLLRADDGDSLANRSVEVRWFVRSPEGTRPVFSSIERVVSGGGWEIDCPTVEGGAYLVVNVRSSPYLPYWDCEAYDVDGAYSNPIYQLSWDGRGYGFRVDFASGLSCEVGEVGFVSASEGVATGHVVVGCIGFIGGVSLYAILMSAWRHRAVSQ